MSRLAYLSDELTKIRSAIDTVSDAAIAEGRDLTDAEQADTDALYARAEQLKPELEKLTAHERSIGAAAEVLARVSRPAPAPAKTDIANVSAGEYFSLYARSIRGDREAELKLRTVATQTTADGILPEPIVGSLFKIADPSRPLVNSFSRPPMPASGKTFQRPRVTQRVNVAAQAAELDELASRKMVITTDTVTKASYGGTLNMSEQDIDWTDPNALQLAIADFIDTYAEVTEAATCTWFPTTVSASSAWTATNIGTVVTSVLNDISSVYSASKKVPDTLWLSLDESLELAGMTNTNMDVTASERIRVALREAGYSLNFVVAPGLASNTRILGSRANVEFYEQTKGFLQAVDVAHRGLDLSYLGYTANYAVSSAFVKLV